ncbi:hypothetical protein BMS3Bbin02_01464 [bacterium BMS3Bbin02]|nr:hypothetical protein BMS3Bbin02_01464 [bacterium BMS3Bbin02]
MVAQFERAPRQESLEGQMPGSGQNLHSRDAVPGLGKMAAHTQGAEAVMIRTRPASDRPPPVAGASRGPPEPALRARLPNSHPPRSQVVPVRLPARRCHHRNLLLRFPESRVSRIAAPRKPSSAYTPTPSPAPGNHCPQVIRTGDSVRIAVGSGRTPPHVLGIGTRVETVS